MKTTILAILAGGVVLAGCSSTSSESPAAAGSSSSASPAAASEPSAEVVVKEKMVAFRANTTPLIRRQSEFTAGCWEASKPFFEMVGDLNPATDNNGSDVSVTVTGDTAVATFVDGEGKEQSEKWRRVGGEWLIDCP